jgi:hypothetical protein
VIKTKAFGEISKGKKITGESMRKRKKMEEKIIQ